MYITLHVVTPVITNITEYVQCKRCEHWIHKKEMEVHMSYHAAIVEDGLLLGDKWASMSKKEMMERMKVTHIVNCAAELGNHFEEEGIKYMNLGLEDNLTEDPIPELERGLEFISK
jgi:hypothetical protein